MNIVFWFVIIIAMVFFWFALSPLFKYVGMFFRTIFDDAKEEMNEEYELKDKNKE